MWDIFNKETVKELSQVLRDQKEAVEKLNRELRNGKYLLEKKEKELSDLELKYKETIKEAELKQEALDQVLDEFKNLLIQNKNDIKNYESLDLTRELIDDFADLNEFIISINLLMVSIRPALFQQELKNYLNNSPIVSSYNFNTDNAIQSGTTGGKYFGIITVFSIDTIQTVQKNITSFLNGVNGLLDKNAIENNDTLIINGFVRRQTHF